MSTRVEVFPFFESGFQRFNVRLSDGTILPVTKVTTESSIEHCMKLTVEMYIDGETVVIVKE